MTGNPSDLASKEHWDLVHDRAGVSRPASKWSPTGSHDMMALEYSLRKEIVNSGAKSLLEIGCGNSVWLPYFANNLNMAVAGIDLSEQGCRLAEEQLRISGAKGVVHCRDVFKCTAGEIGQFDFVYSLGVVEHFTDLPKVLSKFVEFVKPGGVLFSEIPNFPSFHSAFSRFWQPGILARHNLSAKSSIMPACRDLGLTNIRGGYLGLFSLDVVAWGMDPRFPRLERILMPLIKLTRRLTRRLLCHSRRYEGGHPYWAPFYYVAANKPGAPTIATP
jgi:2-polyprenyl-6-hydroxyphenyl methylase/3-demethylubiquinone-9 3-methyltransferase